MLSQFLSSAFSSGRWPWRASLVVYFANLVLPAGGQTPTFAPALNFDTGANSGPLNVVAADVTGDGQLDVLTANP